MKIRSWRQWFNQSNKGEKRKIPPLGWMGVAVLLVLMISALTYSAVKGGLRLIGVSPSGEVELRTNLTFTFSAPVVDKEEVGVTFEGDPIRFTPATRGKFMLPLKEVDFRNNGRSY